MKSIESFETSEATNTCGDRILELYEAGKVFTKDRDVQPTCEVYMAATEFATEFGKDLAKAAGETATGPATYSLLYNLRIQIEQHVGNGYCAVGIQDTSRRVSYYLGIRRCRY